jgi:hypothetical protein
VNSLTTGAGRGRYGWARLPPIMSSVLSAECGAISLLAAFRPGAVGLGEFPFHVARVEMKHASARARKSLVIVTPYPSDTLLSYLAAVARKIYSDIIW